MQDMIPLSQTASALIRWLSQVLERLAQDPAKVIQEVLSAWDVVRGRWDKLQYHGMYEILDYDATLEIADARGEKAVLTRREVVRFLQDNVVAIHDHAWGDGKLFARYRCQPGVPVDFYEDGSKHNILISLRETKNRGDEVEFWIERVIRNGFPGEQEWLETEIDHWMMQLKLAVVFPRDRPARRATLSRRSTGKTTLLSQKHFALLPDGRQKLTWDTKRPKLHDRYTIKWVW
jgi:hypothetical protein